MKTQSDIPRIPDRLTAVVLADGKAAQGILVMLSLEMSKKNSFNFIFGPSDRHGKIQVSKKDLEKEVERSLNVFPTDYEDLSCFQGMVIVQAMSLDQIQSAIAAYDTYHEAAGYSSGYREKLETARSTLCRLLPKRLDIKVIESLGKGRTRIIARPLLLQANRERLTKRSG